MHSIVLVKGMCSLQAHKLDMTYPRYVYITYGWYANYWWVPKEDINCTVQEMEEVLDNSLAMFAYPRIQNSSEVIDAGIVSINHYVYTSDSIGFICIICTQLTCLK